MRTVHALTFRELSSRMSDRAEKDGLPTQSVQNLMGALRGFMSQFSYTEDCPVGSSLRVSYYQYLKKHIALLAAQGKGGRYIANRKSLLGKWHSLAIHFDQQVAAENADATPLQLALRQIFEQAPSMKRVAVDAGVAPSSLRAWTRGVRPNSRALPSLRRLELFFGLNPGALVDLVGLDMSPAQSCDVSVGDPPKILYRARLAAAVSEPAYCLREVTSNLKQEWAELLIFKTGVMPELQRQKTGRWSTTSKSPKHKSEQRWYCFLGKHYVATADVAWRHVSNYLGWLSLPKERGGPGLPSPTTQTLGWLLVPALLRKYLMWRVARADNIVHSGITYFIKFVSSLTHPQTGYLTQTPTASSNLPDGTLVSTDIKVICAEAFHFSRNSIATLAEQTAKSRNPMEPLKAVLELRNPLEAVGDMVIRMKAERPMTEGTSDAVWARDLLLIKILSSNPIRAKNLKMMTFAQDNSGNLYQTADGSWRLRFDKSDFKNFRGAAKDREYDMPIDKSAWGDIERYIKRYRPLLPYAAELPYVFLSSDDKHMGPWENLNRRVFNLTKRFLWRCPGDGPHGFRHIVATSILKLSPNDWQTAALVLHDQVATVEKHYAHLRSCDGGTRMLNLLGSTFSRM